MLRPRFLFGCVALLVATSVWAQNWSSPATWGGRLPRAGEIVTIPAGKTVVLDTATPSLGGLCIEGSLIAGGSRDIAITSNWVVVKGGLLQIGSAANPWLRRATITLTGTRTTDIPTLEGLGNKVLGVMGGRLELHGRPVTKSWTKLGADVAAGANRITLSEPMNWQPGDQIVIATSSPNQNHHSVATITAVNGTTVTLSAPLRFGHIGTLRRSAGRDLDLRAEVGLLSRNVVVQGDASSTTSRVGGHAMFMNGMCSRSRSINCRCVGGMSVATIQIANTEFRRMGQLNRTGRYPVHFHQMGALENSYFSNNTIRNSIQRGLVLHDVSNVRVEGNVIFNTVGHNLVVETEITTGNVIDGNLALVNRQANPLQTAETFLQQNDRLPANFWLKSGRNRVTNNVAAGSFANGFIYDDILSDGPLHFTGNVAHGVMCLSGVGEGDFDIKAGMLIFAQEERTEPDLIADNLVYHNAVGFWPEETGLFRVDRLTMVDNEIQFEGRGAGNRVLLRDALFVNDLTFRQDRLQIMFQYGSDVYLEGATFVNARHLASFADVAIAPNANLWVRNPTFINGRPAPLFDDESVVTYLDDSVLPRGTYVADRRYSTADATQVFVEIGEDTPWPFWKMTERPRYGEVDVRRRSALGTRIHRTSPITRHDGFRYLGAMFGYPVVQHFSQSYELAGDSPQGYAIRMNDGNEYDSNGGAQDQYARVVVPMAAPPSGVFLTGFDFNSPGSVSGKPRLRAATSLSDFMANPLTSYWYDAAARKLHLTAQVQWVQVVP